MASYVQVGKSGLRVSNPILGGMTFGSEKWSPWVLGEAKALPLLKAAWDLGINTIDTANMYSNGVSEEIIGTFIKQYKIPRQQVVILTKIFNLVPEDPSVLALFQPGLGSTKEFVNQGGLSRTAIINQVDASLARLGTTYIDLLQIHMFDSATPIEETMRALHDLVQQGKVRYLGAANLRTWQLAEMNNVAEKNGWTPFIATQVEHSLLYRPFEYEMFGYAAHKGIGLLAYAPLMDGHLARPVGTETARSKAIAGSFFEKGRRPSDVEIIKRVEETAGKKGWTMSQVALAWSSSKVAAPIVGANTPARLADSVTTGKTLTAEEIAYLEQPYEHQAPRF